MGRKFRNNKSISKVFQWLENRVAPDYVKFWYYPGETLDLSWLDTSNITDMERMLGATEVKSLDLSKFNTSNVTNMKWALSRNSNLTSLDVSNFDTSKVTNMDSMFFGNSKLTELDLSSFDVRNVLVMSNMFDRCSNLVKLKTFKITNLYETKAKLALSGLWYSEKLERFLTGSDPIPEKDVLTKASSKKLNTSWKTVEPIKSLLTTITDVIITNEAPEGATYLQNVGVDDANNKIDAYQKDTTIYWVCSGVTNPKLAFVNPNGASMFSGLKGLKTVTADKFDTGSVQYMNNMFANCSSLVELDLSFWDTTSVTTKLASGGSFASMFLNCSSLTSLNLSSFVIAQNNYSLTSMFSGCTSLKYLNIENLNIYGSSQKISNAFKGVPDDCEIIVYSDDVKNIISAAFPNLTNIKVKGEV